MMNAILAMSLAAGVLAASLGMAQTTAVGAPPAGSTGLCKDGSYWQGATKQGACRGHHGVKDWYATNAASAATATVPAATASATAPTQAASASPATAVPVTQMAAAKPVASAPTIAPMAPGGGSGQVWANLSSKVYHCSTDRWYGKTKDGKYLSEADAVAQGFHPDHGKACH